MSKAKEVIQLLRELETGVSVHAKQVSHGDKVADSDLFTQLREALDPLSVKLVEALEESQNSELISAGLIWANGRIQSLKRAIDMSNRSRAQIWQLAASNSGKDALFSHDQYAYFEQMFTNIEAGSFEQNHLVNVGVSVEPENTLEDTNAV